MNSWIMSHVSQEKLGFWGRWVAFFKYLLELSNTRRMKHKIFMWCGVNLWLTITFQGAAGDPILRQTHVWPNGGSAEIQQFCIVYGDNELNHGGSSFEHVRIIVHIEYKLLGPIIVTLADHQPYPAKKTRSWCWGIPKWEVHCRGLPH